MCVGERSQLLGGQGVEPQPAALRARGRLDEALGEARRVLAGRGHDEDAVGDEPPHHEQQRPQRRHIRPVRVVEEQHDRVLVLQRAEQLEDPRSRAEMIGLARRRLARAAQELVDDAERQVALGEVAARAQDGDVGDRAEELLDERRLPDARGTLDEHEPRLPAARACQSLLQRLQLPLPADEDRGGGRRLQLPLRGHALVRIYPASS